MNIDIITLFPEMFQGPFDHSIIKRAQERKLVNIRIHNLRKWGINERGTVDDRPYGGGVGMLLMVEPFYKALEELKTPDTRTILLTPQGTPFTQEKSQELSGLKHVILIAGHYEGYDERVRTHLVDEELSIGDYVLTGGELPAMVVTDSVVRLIPGVLNKEEAVQFESFSEGLLEYPQYTRPEEYMGWKVPEVLISGHHGEIDKWRKEQSIKRTRERRSDLLSDKQ